MTKLEEIEARLAASTLPKLSLCPEETWPTDGRVDFNALYLKMPVETGADRLAVLREIPLRWNEHEYLLDRVKRLESALTDINELTCLDHDEAGKIARAALAEPQP